MELWTALGLGFIGSFHCVGMCGPIVLGLPRTSSNLSTISLNATIYNIGRILVYAILGLLFGLLGNKITLAGFQSSLSIFLGLFIIIGALFSKKILNRNRSPFFQNFVSMINKSYGKLIRKNSKIALFGMGILNGLLPCAFVYSGLAVAVLSETPYHSMIYMALFGLGTMPALFTIYLSPSFISLDLRKVFKKYLPYMTLALGLFLVMRGVVLHEKLTLPDIIIDTVEPFCVFPSNNI
jgi:sulfite exporter TauE/SafE